MLVVNRSPRGEVLGVHYLPEGTVEVPGLPLRVERNENGVVVHLPHAKIEVNPPITLNFTESMVTIVPLEKIFERDGERVVERVKEIEDIVFNENLPPRVRRFLRHYGALLALRNLFQVPESFRENIALAASRLLGVPLGEILMKREKILEGCEQEVRDALKKMTPEELLALFRHLSL